MKGSDQSSSVRSGLLFPGHIDRPNVSSLDLQEEWMRCQLRQRPDDLLVSQKTETERYWVPQILRTDDHAIRQRFPGAHFFRDRVKESEDFTLFERTTD